MDEERFKKLKPNEVIAKLRKEGFNEPFEFHVKK